MGLAADILLMLIAVQTALKISQWHSLLARAAFCTAVALFLVLAVDWAADIPKTQVTAWLHDPHLLRDMAAVCLIDALLTRFRWYPGLLILPAGIYVLFCLLFTMTGTDFLVIALSAATAAIATPLLLSAALGRLLPERRDRTLLHGIVTLTLCLVCLLNTQQELTTLPANQQNIIMDYISKALFGIANIMLIPDVILLIIFFIRALILLASTYRQHLARQGDQASRLYTRYKEMLYSHEPDEAYADYLSTLFEDEAAKDVNLSRLLTKVGPVLGLIGTLISMSPALVGLSEGDISGMAYNMQVVFSATVVGLFISIVGLFTQQLKTRWYAKDLGKLDYVSRIYVERHEKEA